VIQTKRGNEFAAGGATRCKQLLQVTQRDSRFGCDFARAEIRIGKAVLDDVADTRKQSPRMARDGKRIGRRKQRAEEIVDRKLTALSLITGAFLLALAAGNARAQGSAPACDAAGEIALLPSPWAPWKGAPLRVMLVSIRDGCRRSPPARTFRRLADCNCKKRNRPY
jgi:hypothetical protein